MAAAQVLEAITSHWSNRRNDFRDAVSGSSLPADIKSALHLLNRWNSIFRHGDLVHPKSGVVLWSEDHAIRSLARSIWRGIRKQHRLPNLANLNPRIDARGADIQFAQPGGRFGLWVLFKLPRHGKFFVPVQDHAGRQRRHAPLCKTVQLVLDRDGVLSVRLFSDETGNATQTRQTFQPAMEDIGIDFGLATMFATSEGDLLGRLWFTELKKRDANLTRIARSAQKAGLKPRQTKRYRSAVTRMRGYIETEIRRVLNRLINVRGPACLVLERLNFQCSGLTRRLNRILQNCGRAAIKAKLLDLEDRLGIKSIEVNPAYSSQECNACRHISRKNRKAQAQFVCISCGHAVHADVGGARNIKARRSWPDRARLGSKTAALSELAKRFQTGVNGANAPPDALTLKHHTI